MGNVGVIPSRIPQKIGTRRYPSYVHPQMNRELSDLWNIVRLGRMESNRWELAPLLNPPRNDVPTLRLY